MGRILNEGYDLVGKANLCGDVPAIVQYILQALFHHIRQVLCQNLGGLRLVNGRNRFAGIGDLRKLAVQGGIDDLFVEAGRQHDLYASYLLFSDVYCT